MAGTDLAERLEVSVRTLRRDIDRLLRMTTDSLDWSAMALGAPGADFEVLSPPELLGHLHEWGRRFSRASGPSDSG